MGQDVVKTVTLNGARLQTGRDVLDAVALSSLAGYRPGALVRVTVRERLATVASARELAMGETVPVADGLVFEVRARV